VKKNFSDVADAIEAGTEPDPESVLELINQVRTTLGRKYRGNPEEIRDIVYRSMEYVIVRLQAKKIRHKKYLLHYLYTNARHRLIKNHYKKADYVYLDSIEDPEVADSILQVSDPEYDESAYFNKKEKIRLHAAIGTLSEDRQKLAWYILENPQDSTQDVADALGFSHGYCRTLKHRTIHQLRKLCG
jgi:RNA polymerase sigma factor (sigma-70 family)